MPSYASAYKKDSALRHTRMRRDRFSAVAVVVFFALGVSFFLVYKRTVGQHLVNSIQRLHSIQSELATEHSILLARRQEYLSRERITMYAGKHLGLEFPAPECIRWIRIEVDEPLRTPREAVALSINILP